MALETKTQIMTYINKFITVRTIIALAVAMLVLVSVNSSAHAQSIVNKFNQNLYFGTVSSDVEDFQIFLQGQGYFTSPVNGKFDKNTKEAVIRFQRAHVIPGTGNVGPLTRGIANIISASSLDRGSLAMINPLTGNIEVGQTQNVNWTSDNYGSSNVKINLIRKVSENPNRYELVRTIATSTMNDGVAVWVPAPTDMGKDLSIEVGCVGTTQTCQATDATDSSMAVINTGRFSNTANAYKAIEQLYNK